MTAELKRLAGDGPVPAVALTDKPRSTAYPARPWRPARIEIRREIAARGPSDALRGEVAHEYAHVFHEQFGRMARLCGLLTHPSPARRRRELLGAGVERSSARALREAVR